jgi:HK97 family phage major capsid protein
MNLHDIQNRLAEISVDVEALIEVAGDSPSAEHQEQILALNKEAQELEAKHDEAKKFEKAKAEIVARRKLAAEAADAPAAGVQPSVSEDLPKENNKMAIPAKARYAKSRHFDNNEDAYEAGMFLAAIGGNKKAQDFMAAQSLTDNKGGFSVPQPLSDQLINLVEEYGHARQSCRRVVMGASTWSVPKISGHSVVYYPAEAAAITESDLTFSQITLTAKKMAGLVKMSSEIAEDSIISMLDTVVDDLAWGFSKAEDDNLFTGGSIYTGGIKGDANVADTNVASVGALALTDLTAMVVASGQERGLNPKFYMNPTLWNGQVRDLLNAAGGNASADVAAGVQRSLFGYEVVLCNAIPGASASTSGDLLAVFGDLSVSHYFGDRRQLSFKVLDQLFAVNDQIGVVCTSRIDIAAAAPEVLSKITIT